MRIFYRFFWRSFHLRQFAACSQTVCTRHNPTRHDDTERKHIYARSHATAIILTTTTQQAKTILMKHSLVLFLFVAFVRGSPDRISVCNEPVVKCAMCYLYATNEPISTCPTTHNFVWGCCIIFMWEVKWTVCVCDIVCLILGRVNPKKYFIGDLIIGLCTVRVHCTTYIYSVCPGNNRV